MNLAFSDEQEELRRSVRRFLADKSPESEVRRLMATDEGYDPDVWAQMAQQLGLLGLAIPEEFGGSGFSFVELVVVLEEMGRALLCAPFFSTVVLAGGALLASGDDAAKKEFLPGIAAGELLATLALTEDSARWDEAAVTTAATAAGEGFHLTGHKTFVIDGHRSDVILVAARTERGVSLFAVTGDAPGLVRQSMPTMDQTRKQSRLTFEHVPARLVGAEGQGWPIVAQALDRAAVALAAEQVGGAQRVLEMSVEYAKTRIQFGRPIGSFQAIKHKCADMLVGLEWARSASAAALDSVDGEAGEMAGESDWRASMAKAVCSEALRDAAHVNVQIHGGIGFTWEDSAHLYLRRARTDEVLFGGPGQHWDRLAARKKLL
ncbi:MAG TPA: acyl-CoA dehydrogenase family protein [Acidimicrobiales bacterium]|nr:acyl-CoA dehydrogenase family protein [Acidimicrobiales bacterium]